MSSEYYGYRNGHSVSSGVQYRPKARKGKGAGGEQGLSNGLIILVIAIVVGCFAVLWPKYFYPMLFGESLHQPRTDPETMFMSGAHGREYLHNKLKERGGGHPGLHPGTGEGGQARARMTPPIRTADVSYFHIIIIIIIIIIITITITITLRAQYLESDPGWVRPFLQYSRRKVGEPSGI